MADKRNPDQDEVVTGGIDEEIRGVADEDDEFDSEDLDEDEAEEEEEGSTF